MLDRSYWVQQSNSIRPPGSGDPGLSPEWAAAPFWLGRAITYAGALVFGAGPWCGWLQAVAVTAVDTPIVQVVTFFKKQTLYLCFFVCSISGNCLSCFGSLFFSVWSVLGLLKRILFIFFFLRESFLDWIVNMCLQHSLFATVKCCRDFPGIRLIFILIFHLKGF